ncbi:MAG: transaldolase [Clostridium sp.]|nr:transaldolase [Ruminococcus flavefaciens]MCM1499467.1 transaldolase [Clostridium sp.]
MKFEDLKIAIYADGADIDVMRQEYSKGIVKGFTTNPSLMKKAGVQSYTEFAKTALTQITDLPISFEVFADDFDGMKREARILSSYGKNVFVKIPATNSLGESSIGLIRELSAEGIKLNVTALFTVRQVKAAVDAFSPGTENIISVFAGRITDTGVDAEEIMKETVRICRGKPGTKSLWASCREVFNIIQADRCGADIITVTEDIMKKLPLLGKDLEEYSVETVQLFVRDGRSLGFVI